MTGGGENPWHVAWRSTVANVGPMVILWALAALTVAGYYSVPAFREALGPLSTWQREQGSVAAFISRFVFCGLLPGVFMLTMKRLTVPRPFLALVVQSIWSGLCGIVSGWMFDLHAHWFGEGVDFLTLAVKTAMQQFVWTPLYFAPVGAVVYFWIGRGLSVRRVRAEWPRDFLRTVVLPNLMANWVVWVPVGMMIHMFETPLQVQLAGFANAFLCLVLLTLGKRK